jgi:hypothetical protein
MHELLKELGEDDIQSLYDDWYIEDDEIQELYDDWYIDWDNFDCIEKDTDIEN